MEKIFNKRIIIGFLITLSLIIISCLGLAYYFYKKQPICETSNELATINYESNVAEKSDEIPNQFFVEIKGAVKTPGVYLASEENIINDIIKLAGGFKSNAYTNNINLSKKVTKEMVIYVFTKSEYKGGKLVNENTTNSCLTNSYNIDNCTNNSSSVIEVTTNQSINDNSGELEKGIENSKDEVKIVNINTATLNDFTTLPGIGESKAKSIIAYREENGLFKSIEEIKNVSGIGDAIYEKFKNFITI